jgi:hypothetical protein
MMQNDSIEEMRAKIDRDQLFLQAKLQPVWMDNAHQWK